MKRLQFIIYVLFLFAACTTKSTLFELVKPDQSGISFVNKITAYDSFNILNTEFIYNGAGVAVGDLNGDGLEDLYFTGNQVGNACYLNKGGLKFEDITDAAGVQKKPGQWSSGVNMIDINTDGKLDIYVCNTLIRDGDLRKNLLFINQGNQGDIPIFTESTAEYGLDDTSHSSHAQWLDYDLDGDLDLFIGTNYIDRPRPGTFIKDANNDCAFNCDKLYRNDWDSISGHPRFKDVSAAAGMSFHGYSHSTLIYDFNEDGWPDIYVANDYLSDDLIYINKQDGTFKNQAGDIFRHQSSSAMGSDLGDINNDGRMEVVTAEMLPNTNLRKKTLLGPNNYSSYLYIKEYGYQFQYTRNTLQFNNGIVPETQLPSYSDISFLSGVHETEWSWAPLFADFDRDGWEDLYITNGFPKDVTDHDFGEYRSMANNLMSDMDLQGLIPVVRVSNFQFKNQGDLRFKDVTKEWGLDYRSFSYGAVYSDLDQDGDLELVVHNTDDPPYLFKNLSTEKNKQDSTGHYIQIKLKGNPKNPDAIGAKVSIYYQDRLQSRNILSGRGYLSQPSLTAYFGLGPVNMIDSILVHWPDRTVQKLGTTIANQLLIVEYGGKIKTVSRSQLSPPYFLAASPGSLGLNYQHEEKDFIDFNIQKTVPHKMSQNGAPMAVGDINGDGLDDLVIGASALQDEVVFIQGSTGRFQRRELILKEGAERQAEDACLALIDADGDGDLDLVVARGSYENLMSDPKVYNVRYFKNDGKGYFTADTTVIPSHVRTSASVIKAADIDLDGDPDLFIGGQVLPGYYPMADKSFILINTSGPEKTSFEEATGSWGKSLEEVGIVNDALWSDYDNDGKPDLFIATEWGPVQIFHNESTHLSKVVSPELDKNTGWWTSLVAGDLDNDGDMDYVAGNYGQNVYFKCSSKEPITIYAKDFDSNGSLDPFISCYWRDTSGNKKEYFFHGRDDMIKQLILIRRKFQTYTSFGLATVDQVFTPQELNGSIKMQAVSMSSVVLLNQGQGKFEIRELPVEAQFAPLYGMQMMDVNRDDFLDMVLTGNDFGIELTQGRADAMNGLVLLNDTKGNFKSLSLNESGVNIPGDSKGLVMLNAGSRNLLLAMRNLDSLAVFGIPRPTMTFAPLPGEFSATIRLSSGLHRKIEFYNTSSYNTQSTLVQSWMKGFTSITFTHAVNKSQRVINATLQ